MATPLTIITEETRKTPAYYKNVKLVTDGNGVTTRHQYTYMQVTTEETMSYIFGSMAEAEEFLHDFYAVNPPESDNQTDGIAQRYNAAGFGEVKIIVTNISDWEVVKDEVIG